MIVGLHYPPPKQHEDHCCVRGNQHIKSTPVTKNPLTITYCTWQTHSTASLATPWVPQAGNLGARTPSIMPNLGGSSTPSQKNTSSTTIIRRPELFVPIGFGPLGESVNSRGMGYLTTSVNVITHIPPKLTTVTYILTLVTGMILLHHNRFWGKSPNARLLTNAYHPCRGTLWLHRKTIGNRTPHPFPPEVSNCGSKVVGPQVLNKMVWSHCMSLELAYLLLPVKHLIPMLKSMPHIHLGQILPPQVCLGHSSILFLQPFIHLHLQQVPKPVQLQQLLAMELESLTAPSSVELSGLIAVELHSKRN